MPTTLRVVLIENLRRLAERAAAVQAARHAAHRWMEVEGLRDRGALLARIGAVLEPIDLDITGEGQHLVVVMGDRAPMPAPPVPAADVSA